MEIKIGRHAAKEMTEKGEGVAVIATLNVPDHDGDVTLPGAFGEQVVPMVPAHDWQAAPIGKARIHEEGEEVHADFKINRQTTLGKDWFEALRFDFDNPPPKQEYSYGFSVVESGEGQVDMPEGGAPMKVRFLRKLDVAEVSPVLKGAGVNTRTLALKGRLAEKFAQPMPLADHLALLGEEAERALDRIADLEEKRLLGASRAKEVQDLARLFGDIKAALEAPPDEAVAARILARNLALRQRMAAAGVFS